MKKREIGTAALGKDIIRYHIVEEMATEGVPSYGVMVAFRGEESMIRGLSTSKEKVLELLRKMRIGLVTPVSAEDVAEDWLAEG